MSTPAFPFDGSVCGAVSPDAIYEEPEQPKDKKRLRMYGMLENHGYQIYERPRDTKASEVVRYFRYQGTGNYAELGTMTHPLTPLGHAALLRRVTLGFRSHSQRCRG